MTVRLCSVLFLSVVLVGVSVEGCDKAGGLSESKRPTPKVQAIVDGVKHQVEERLGHKVDRMILLSYRTQVVAGFNYFAKVDIGEEDVVHLRIYESLDQNVTLHGMQYPKSRSLPIEYFSVNR